MDVLSAGEVRRMTAGSGILHSEFNHSPAEELHLLQIWILPEASKLTPGYEQKATSTISGEKTLKLVIGKGASNGALHINQQAELYVSELSTGESFDLSLGSNHWPADAWVQLVKGELTVSTKSGRETLHSGDGLAVTGEEHITAQGSENSLALVFKLRR